MGELGIFEQRQVKARQVITRRGDPGKRVYIVLDGSVQIAGQGDSEVFGAGRIFGRLDLLRGEADVGAYTQTATALTEATILFADASQLRDEIENGSPTVRALARHAVTFLT